MKYFNKRIPKNDEVELKIDKEKVIEVIEKAKKPVKARRESEHI